ncbi:MAG TPA: Tm-1-like ATP-binding domain-containing protein [Syntrophomonas sp.]|nr:Tm-1-like ATP-binding domain-containing protein [Syntrophomonas sp.]
MKAKILVAGILDTKGEEIKYIAQQVAAAGGLPTILELSVGKEVGWADIGLTEILKEIGKKSEELYKVDRHQASAWVTEAAIKYVGRLVEQGEVDGIIACGGSMGASIGTAIMQSMPIGMPKVMVTTMTSGDVRPYVGTSDICMMYPIAEAGINALTKKIFTNAAGAIVGMANSPEVDTANDKPMVGCMMFGVTTPCVLRASKSMEDYGYEVMINHAIGSGGLSMEQLIDGGYIKGILDITTHEIADEMLGGVLSAGPERLTAAGRAGIPQVIAPGGLDLINFGPKDTVPEHYMQQTHLPGRSLYEHNPAVTCVGILPDEAYQIAVNMAIKLNKAQSPTVVCVPMRGWGACDLKVADKELGWAGPGAGPSWVSDPNKPEWSLRSKRFLDGLKEYLDLSKPNIELLVVDKHLNEPEFADLMSGLLKDMLDGKWQKNSRGNLPYVQTV